MQNELGMLNERERMILEYFDRYEKYAAGFAEFLQTMMRGLLPYLPTEEEKACDIVSTQCSLLSLDEWVEHERLYGQLEWRKYTQDVSSLLPEEYEQRFDEMMRNYEERRQRGEVECLFGEDELLEVQSFALLSDYRIVAEFSSNECRLFNLVPLLDRQEYMPLQDAEVFSKAVLDPDSGSIMWCDGAIMLSPEDIYEQGEPFQWRA